MPVHIVSGRCSVGGIPLHVICSNFGLVSLSQTQPGRKTPAETGREGLWNVIKAAYAAAFPQDHPCHSGPVFGKVV